MKELEWIRWRPLFKWNPFKPCMCCNRRMVSYWEPQNTAYSNAKSNWAFLCKPCHIENDEYWRGAWIDYWNMVY